MIVACFDLTGGWTFSGDPTDTFAVCFADGDADRLYPNGLSFGYTVKAGTKNVDTAQWPPSNVVVRELTPQRTFEFRPALNADDKVTLKVWAFESGRRIDGEFKWKVPRPVQPFPSWVWTDGAWTSPVPYPQVGVYSWDETSGSWVPVDGEG